MPRKYKKYSKMVKKSKAITKETVKRMIIGQLEKKYWDISFSSPVTNLGTMIALSNIVQGSDDNSRDGEQVRVLKSTLRLVFRNVDNTNILRVIVFRWMDNTNLAVPTVAQILQGAPSIGPYVLSDYNYDNKRAGQFQIVYDKVLTASNAGPALVFKRDKSYYPSVPINFTDVNAQNHGTGKFYMLLISDSDQPAHPGFDMFHRLVFHDA